jgi:uncharacterized protein Yka (UPF0111/DUF47 family)
MTKMINQMAEQQKEIIRQLLMEIQEIPLEQQKHLLQIVQTFKKAIDYNSNHINANQSETESPIQKNQAILELLDKWEASGDELEQTETLSYLLSVCS